MFLTVPTVSASGQQLKVEAPKQQEDQKQKVQEATPAEQKPQEQAPPKQQQQQQEDKQTERPSQLPEALQGQSINPQLLKALQAGSLLARLITNRAGSSSGGSSAPAGSSSGSSSAGSTVGNNRLQMLSNAIQRTGLRPQALLGDGSSLASIANALKVTHLDALASKAAASKPEGGTRRLQSADDSSDDSGDNPAIEATLPLPPKALILPKPVSVLGDDANPLTRYQVVGAPRSVALGEKWRHEMHDVASGACLLALAKGEQPPPGCI